MVNPVSSIRLPFLIHILAGTLVATGYVFLAIRSNTSSGRCGSVRFSDRILVGRSGYRGLLVLVAGQADFLKFLADFPVGGVVSADRCLGTADTRR